MNRFRFELLIAGPFNNAITHWIDTDTDILSNYKNSLVLGSGIIAWEKGAIDSKKIIAIFDKTVPLPIPQEVKK